MPGALGYVQVPLVACRCREKTTGLTAG